MEYRATKPSLSAGVLAAMLGLLTGLAQADDLSNWRAIKIPGATDVRAQGINSVGQVAGTYTLSDNSIHGFMWNPNGSIMTIDVTTPATFLFGINNKGETAGYSGTNGFIRGVDGTMQTVTYPSGPGGATRVYGLNDLDQVVGTAVGFATHAFMTTTGGSFINIDPPPGFFPLVPVGINNSGLVVGIFFEQASGIGHGFLRNTDGTFTTIDVPGAAYTGASGINGLGQIVGYYGFIPASNPHLVQNRGFIRDTNGTITTFDAPYLGSTQPNGIADTGMIAASFSRNPENEPPNIGLVRKCLLCP